MEHIAGVRQNREPNFIDSYLHYIGHSESPTTFQRWSILATLGAWLGKRFYFKHGHSQINSNMYVMLMGAAGTRKSTAIKVASKLIKKAGYSTFSSSKCSKEQFLVDLAATGQKDSEDYDSILDKNLWGNDAAEESSLGDCEIFVNPDEFNDFVGLNNIEFLSLLGSLWDWSGSYTHSKLTSKSVFVKDPCVSILAGNTSTGFSLAFPKESIGQGIFSRLILVHGESNGNKIAFPKPPKEEATAALIQCLLQIRAIAQGEAELEPDAKEMLELIYTTWKPIDDTRFDSYSNRRFTHLLKLCLIHAASRKSKTISIHDVVLANTVLSHAEHSMAKALGEFGASQKSDVTNKIMVLLTNTRVPLTFKDIWKHIINDVNTATDLRGILENLIFADKIFKVTGSQGYLAKRVLIAERSQDKTVDFSLLTEAEREYLA